MRGFKWDDMKRGDIKKGDWKKFQELYDEADTIFFDRFDRNGQVGRDYDDIMNDIENEYKEKAVRGKVDYNLKRMVQLTKANVYLRKGQYRDEHFLESEPSYRKAVVLLEQIFEPDTCSDMDLLIQLNLGKYFRNIAKHGRRSDYWRALDEFEGVKNMVEQMAENNNGLTMCRTQLWLEAVVNIGRAQKYLYQLEEAKKCFCSLIKLLLGRISENHGNIEQELQKKKELGLRLQSSDEYSEIKGKMHGDEHLYKDYLKQALVQLGITYQKSRDYDLAEYLCDVTLKFDTENIDAKNNKAVCERKSGKKISEIKNDIKSLLQEGNRFAKIHYIKCLITEEEHAEKGAEEKTEQEENALQPIEKILAGNPNDMEVLFLKALYYKNCGEIEEAQHLFKYIYKRTSYIRKGTIGLKAYYNVAQCMLEKDNIYGARQILEKIIEECTEVSVPNEQSKSKYVKGESDAVGTKKKSDSENQGKWRPGNLPQGDLLSEIDLGWCLMKLGRYGQAQKIYENLLRKYDGILQRMGFFNELKVRNNLSECYLRVGNVDEAEKQIDIVLEYEENNAVALCLKAQWCMIRARENDDISKLEMAMKLFEQAASIMPGDLRINSGWVLSGMELYEKNKHDKKLIKSIEKGIKYSPSLYSMKSCEKLAGFIKDRAKELGKDSSEMQALYRAFARIQLGKTEEGYGTFTNFLLSPRFRRLRAVTRGEILVHLFAIYEQVERIKEMCRYTTSEEPVKHDFPVHYTKIETLKKLLPKEGKTKGRLRLMNTDYTNDFFEGNLFLELMNQANLEEDSKERLAKYFPHWNNTSDTIIPRNGNVYFTSFSKRKDDIHMWIPYADDAKGCSIMFAEDFLDIRRKTKNTLGTSDFSDQDYPLYEVQYIDLKEFERIVAGNTSENVSWESDEEKKLAEILTCLQDIWAYLTELRDCLRNLGEQDQNNKEVRNGTDDNIHWLHTEKDVYKFVADCLDEIRFLFKDPEYSHEQELRLIKHSYKPEIDEQSCDIPRLYVEVDRMIRIEEVCLGTKNDPLVANEIASWLYETNSVHDVSVSKRHYR